MDENEFTMTEITRRTVIETGTTALLLTTLPRGALAAGPLDDTGPPPPPATVPPPPPLPNELPPRRAIPA